MGTAELAQIFYGASEMDLMIDPFLKSRKTAEAALTPASVAIPALESDVKATRILDLVLQSDQGARPTANALVEFVVKMHAIEEKQRELLAVEQKDEEKRVALEWKRWAIFSENMVSCVPWNLPPGELQAWLIKHASPSKKKTSHAQ